MIYTSRSLSHPGGNLSNQQLPVGSLTKARSHLQHTRLLKAYPVRSVFRKSAFLQACHA